MSGSLKILRIEIDGHFHGSADVPKPWVAQITGVDRKYGLARTFVEQLRDYRTAKLAHSGNVYGVVAAFPLHEGRLYEVSRLRGKQSKRHVAREFWRVESGQMVEIDPVDALASADPIAGLAIEHRVPDGTSVSRVDGIGSPASCGFVLTDRDHGDRLYRIAVGSIHEVDTGIERYLILANNIGVRRISQGDALAHLTSALSCVQDAA